MQSPTGQQFFQDSAVLPPGATYNQSLAMMQIRQENEHIYEMIDGSNVQIRPQQQQRTRRIAVNAEPAANSSGKFVDGAKLKKYLQRKRKLDEAIRLEHLQEQVLVTSMTELFNESDRQESTEDIYQVFQRHQGPQGKTKQTQKVQKAQKKQLKIGGHYMPEETIIRLSTFDKDSTLPVITDINDDLTLGSRLAALERHGMTQYGGSIQSLAEDSQFYYIQGVATDNKRQYLVDAGKKQLICQNNLAFAKRQKARKERASSVSSIVELPSRYAGNVSERDYVCQTQREDNSYAYGQRKESLRQEAAMVRDRLATSRGYTCGQCTQCIKSKGDVDVKDFGVLPHKKRIEQEVGNSNQQRMEVLKPKWVDNVDAKRIDGEVPDSDAKSVIFKRTGRPEMFEKQLPTLTTAYSFYDKRIFKPELLEIDIENVHERYISNLIINIEQGYLIEKYDQSMVIQRKQMSNQIKIRFIQYQVANSQEEQAKSLNFLKKLPFKLDQVDEPTIQEMDQVNQIIFEASSEDYQIVFCNSTMEKQIIESEPSQPQQQLTMYRGDMKNLYDPDFAECTFIDSEKIRRLELTIAVLFQFQERVCAWITKRAKQYRYIEELFKQASEEIKTDHVKIKGVQQQQNDDGYSDTTWLEFLDHDIISEPRNIVNRAQVYEHAKQRIPEIIAECQEYGIEKTQQMHDVLHNTDYAALKKQNDQFDIVEEVKIGNIDAHSQYLGAFEEFYEQKRSNSEEVSEQIESETAYLLKPYVTRLDPRFANLMSEYMAQPAHQEEKLRGYSDHVFEEYPPFANLSETEEVDNYNLYCNWINSGDKMHSREQFESSLYKGVVSSAISRHTFYFTKPKYQQFTSYRLKQIQASVEILSIDETKTASEAKAEVESQNQQQQQQTEADKVQLNEEIVENDAKDVVDEQIGGVNIGDEQNGEEIIRSEKADEEENKRQQHQEQINVYRNKLRPVDREMSSDLFAVSFYREEYVTESPGFSNCREIKDQDLSAISSLTEQVVDKLLEINNRMRDHFKLEPIQIKEEDRGLLVTSRTEVIQVYSMTKNNSSLKWLEDYKLNQDLVREIYWRQIEESDQIRQRLAVEHAKLQTQPTMQEEKRKLIKQEWDDYLEIVRLMYKNDIVLRIMPSEKGTKRSSDNTSSKLSRQRSQEQLGSVKLVEDMHRPNNTLTITDQDSEQLSSQRKEDPSLDKLEQMRPPESIQGQAKVPISQQQQQLGSSRLAEIREVVAEEDKQSHQISQPSSNSDSQDIKLDITKRTARVKAEEDNLAEKRSLLSQTEDIMSGTTIAKVKQSQGALMSPAPLRDEDNSATELTRPNQPNFVSSARDKTTTKQYSEESPVLNNKQDLSDADSDESSDDEPQLLGLMGQTVSDRSSMVSEAPAYINYRRGSDNQKNRMHSSLQEPLQPDMKQKDNEIDHSIPTIEQEQLTLISEEFEEQQDENNKNSLLKLLECQEPPLQSLNQLKTLLSHPENDQFNNWMDCDAHDLCYDFSDYKHQMESNKQFKIFDEDDEDKEDENKAASNQVVSEQTMRPFNGSEKSKSAGLLRSMLTYVKIQESNNNKE